MNIYGGFDLSLSATGYAIMQQNGRIIDKGTIKTTPASPYVERIAFIADKIVAIMEQHKPDESVLEEMAMFAPFSSGTIFPLHGAVMYAIAKAGIKQPARISATTLKKFVTGKGRAEKSDMKMCVLEKWGEKLSDDNQCDAYACARVAGALHGSIPAKHHYESECIETLKNKAAKEKQP